MSFKTRIDALEGHVHEELLALLRDITTVIQGTTPDEAYEESPVPVDTAESVSVDVSSVTLSPADFEISGGVIDCATEACASVEAPAVTVVESDDE